MITQDDIFDVKQSSAAHGHRMERVLDALSRLRASYDRMRSKLLRITLSDNLNDIHDIAKGELELE